MQISYEPSSRGEKRLPRGAGWRGLRWQMNAVLDSQLTVRRFDAPQRIFLARDFERNAS